MSAMLFQAFVYLCAAVIAVPLAKKLKLGSVLGYLLAGIVIGKYGLGVVGGEYKEVMHFAEFGVVMMLFLIGLELQPSLLWKMRRPVFIMGGAQVGLTTALFFPVFLWAFELNWQQAIAIAMILALSSTAIVLQTLNEKNQFNTEAGQSSFAILLFQDLAVIPMLSILPLLATLPNVASDHGGHSLIQGLHPGLQTLAIVGVLGAIVVAGRYLSRPLFRIVAEVRMREIFSALALLLVIGIALSMEAIGLSAALGTFVAGVVLAESEYRHELEAVIDPFKGLLLAVFFIAVGASINFQVMVDSPGIVALTVGMLVVGKFGVISLITRLSSIHRRQKTLVGLLLAQGGEFAFVLMTFSVANGVLPETVASLLTASVTISMILTPLILMVYDLIDARFTQVGTASKPTTDIDRHGRVIVCGYGRFGQIVSRLLYANGVDTILLDHNPSQIEMVRRFGIKVYYGDATNVDLLETAGAAKADLIVVAIDNAAQSLEVVHAVRKHFPGLKMLARARDRTHALDLHQAGVVGVFRETFSSAIEMGSEALVQLGFRRHQAFRLGRKFAYHDNKALVDLAPEWGRDDAAYIEKVRQRSESIIALLRRDLDDKDLSEDHAWDGPTGAVSSD